MSQERLSVQYAKPSEVGLPYPYPGGDSGDEIQIGQIILLLKARWRMLAAVSALFVLAGVAYALSRPNIYEAKAVVIANSDVRPSGGGSGLGGLSNLQSPGSLLALMGGGGAGGGNKNIERALITLRSRAFIGNMINSNHLMPVIFPDATPQDMQSEKMFDDACEYLKSSLKAELDIFGGALGVYNLSIQHTSPQSALAILNTVLKTLNEEEKKRVVTKARHEMNYLNGQLPGVNEIFLREALYSIITEKARESTLANVQEEYVFSVIDPPTLPKKKVGPFRTMIVLVFAVVGLLVGILVAVYPVIKDIVFQGVKADGGLGHGGV